MDSPALSFALSPSDLATVVDRMGHLVLGVKALFDLKCSAGDEHITPENAAGTHSRCSYWGDGT